MAANPWKPRPNRIDIALPDGPSYSVKDTKRTPRRHRGMIVGYARTSTTDQAAGLAAQERDLTAAGVERIFGEQLSSVAKRVKLAECLAFMREGDVLTVTKPDRLARSTAELLSIEADLSKRGIGMVVLSMGGERLDTRNPTSKLMLTILAGVATWEREIMLERQREENGRLATFRKSFCDARTIICGCPPRDGGMTTISTAHIAPAGQWRLSCGHLMRHRERPGRTG